MPPSVPAADIVEPPMQTPAQGPPPSVHLPPPALAPLPEVPPPSEQGQPRQLPPLAVTKKRVSIVEDAHRSPPISPTGLQLTVVTFRPSSSSSSSDVTLYSCTGRRRSSTDSHTPTAAPYRRFELK